MDRDNAIELNTKLLSQVMLYQLQKLLVVAVFQVVPLLELLLLRFYFWVLFLVVELLGRKKQTKQRQQRHIQLQQHQ